MTNYSGPRAAAIHVDGVGGTIWHVVVELTDGTRVRCHHPHLGSSLDYGEIDADGQWVGDDDELQRRALAFARESRLGLDIPDDIAIRV